MKAKVTQLKGMSRQYYAIELTERHGEVLTLRAPNYQYSQIAYELTGSYDNHDAPELLQYFQQIVETINK